MIIETYPEEPPTYISFDPGAKFTGVVSWDDKGKMLHLAQYGEKELDKFFDTVPTEKLKTIIYELYRVFDHKLSAHRWSKVETVEAIGLIKHFARKHNLKLVSQPSNILAVAQKWSGAVIPSDHALSHGPSAYNHGYFYLHQQGIIPARVLTDYKED